MMLSKSLSRYPQSHSTRVRGLKYIVRAVVCQRHRVALYTSAWIEIAIIATDVEYPCVALYTSAWIEMYNTPV